MNSQQRKIIHKYMVNTLPILFMFKSSRRESNTHTIRPFELINIQKTMCSVKNMESRLINLDNSD